MEVKVYLVAPGSGEVTTTKILVPLGRDPIIMARACVKVDNWERENVRMPPRRPLLIKSIRVLLSPTFIPHEWHRTRTTLMDKSGLYEIYECKRCGMKGRKYANGDIRPNNPTKWFNACGVIGPTDQVGQGSLFEE